MFWFKVFWNYPELEIINVKFANIKISIININII